MRIATPRNERRKRSVNPYTEYKTAGARSGYFRVKETSDTPLTQDEILAAALLQCTPELRVLDGYERKARSRRKKAFRALWE